MELRNKSKFEEIEIGLIPKEWEVCSFQNVCTLQRGFDLPSKKRNIGKYPLASSNGITAYVSEYKVKAPGVITGRSGTLGKCFFIKKDFWPLNTSLWVKDFKGNYPYYIYLLLSSLNFENFNAGSGVPTLNRNHLNLINVSLPPLNEQKQIAEILSSLDDKIELNRKINSNLEKIASLLFKQWFINTNEKGLKTMRLGDFFPIKTGKKDANIATKNGKYPFFTCSQDILFTDNFSFDSSSILLAGNGDFNIKWYEGKFEAYQRTYVLTPYKKELLGFLYFLMDYFLDDITVGHRGSVIKFITKGMIEDFEVKIPIDKDFNNKAKFFYEIIQVIDFYEKEIKNLSQIRDFLLPRLMNGKIRVKI